MIYIKKQTEVPTVFIEATQNLQYYEALQGKQRNDVTDLLLSEQGGLCAICERKKVRFAPTIEHFLPKSIFPHLQLSYHNLYVACNACNEPKANHIIPPYIFDPRFDPFYQLLNNWQGIKPIYALEDGKCRLTIPAAANYNKAEHFSANMLQATLYLMRQNRYDIDDNMSETNSLIHLRASVYNTIKSQLLLLTDKQLLDKYQRMKSRSEYPEFVSLIAFLYSQEFKRRNIYVLP